MKHYVRKAWLSAVSLMFLLVVSLFAVACGKKTYTLTFVTNGGTEIPSITAEAGAEITPPADPSKQDCVFEGWFTEAEFSGTAVEIPSVMPEGDVTYYAKFTEIPFATLTLDAGVGTLTTGSYRVAVGENVSAFVANITPSVKDGLAFGGWFNGDVPLSSSAKMPSGGLTLTAKYTAEYTVEVYLQEADGETYTLDSSAEPEKKTDWLGTVIDTDAVSNPPSYYRVNRTLTKSLTLGAEGENVFRAYYDRNTYNVYYFDGAPSGTTATGSMDAQTGIINGSKIAVLENEYAIEGYRFAGWATSVNGAVIYRSGDEITIENRHVMLYARWNYGMSDSKGGSDTIYVLAEEENAVLLVREYAGEIKGEYNPSTRIFTFTADNGKKLQGRVSADGTTFAYLYEEYRLTYTFYDWKTESIPSAAPTLALDGMDGAVYTDADGESVEGLYSQADSAFLFTSATEEFYFLPGVLTYEDGEQTNVFLRRDDVAGTFYYMNASGSIYYYPRVSIDGFGEASYSASAENTFAADYTVLEGDLVRITYEDGGETVSVVCKVRTVNTTSGTRMAVFETADAALGTHTFAMEGSGGTGSMTLVLDGFGNAKYDFKGATSGNDASGDTVYQYSEGYSDGTTQWGYIRFTIGTDLYTVRFDLAGEKAASLIGNEAGLYSESGVKSYYTVRARLRGDGSAALEVLMTNGSYVALVEGTYLPYGETGYDYTFKATAYGDGAEGIEDQLALYYGEFTFRLYSLTSGSAFVISDGIEGTYTFSYEGNDYTFTCNGFGYAEFRLASATSGSTVAYRFTEGYGDYRFVSFQLSASGYTYSYTLRFTVGETEADFYVGGIVSYYDLNNRIPQYNELLLMYPDGHATILVLENGTYVALVEGGYEQDGDVAGRYVFSAASYAEGRESELSCYASFRFTYGTAGGSNVFFLYNESEVKEFGETLTLDGYGVAYYNGAQYLYELGDEYIYLQNVSGTVRIVIRRDGADGILEPGTEQGSHYSYLLNEEGQYVIGGYLLELDGYGGATLSRADEESGGYILVGQGTYTGNNEKGYTLVGDDLDLCFVLGSRTANGSAYSVYILADEQAAIVYNIAGGGRIETDAFGRTTYTDGEGNVRSAICLESDDTVVEGRRVVFLAVYDEEGANLTGFYSFVVTDRNGSVVSVTMTDGQSGSYYFIQGGTIHTDTTLLVDGLGNARILKYDSESDSTSVLAEGTYTATDASGVWNFVSATQGYESFTFRLTTAVSTSGTTYYVYVVYEEEWNVRLTSGDWQTVILNGYGTATLIDFFGRTYTVNYEIIGDSGLRLFGSSLGGNRYYTVDLEKLTFEQVTEPSGDETPSEETSENENTAA